MDARTTRQGTAEFDGTGARRMRIWLGSVWAVLTALTLLSPAARAQGQNQGNPPPLSVEVVNTPTVEVEGDVSVQIANTPAVTVQGEASVEIVNTPEVRVVALPDLSLPPAEFQVPGPSVENFYCINDCPPGLYFPEGYVLEWIQLTASSGPDYCQVMAFAIGPDSHGPTLLMLQLAPNSSLTQVVVFPTPIRFDVSHHPLIADTCSGSGTRTGAIFGGIRP